MNLFKQDFIYRARRIIYRLRNNSLRCECLLWGECSLDDYVDVGRNDLLLPTAEGIHDSSEDDEENTSSGAKSQYLKAC